MLANVSTFPDNNNANNFNETELKTKVDNNDILKLIYTGNARIPVPAE